MLSPDKPLTATRHAMWISAIAVLVHRYSSLLFQVKYGAVEGAPLNVRVNGIAPGTVRTPLALTMGEEGLQEAWKTGHLAGKGILPAEASGLTH